MIIFVNPGSGPVADATEAHAAGNMAVFVDDLRTGGVGVDTFTRRAEADYGEGRYAYTIQFSDESTAEIQMPGLPLDRVRYIDSASQNIWDFPRLYVNDSSFVWEFALTVCRPEGEESQRRAGAKLGDPRGSAPSSTTHTTTGSTQGVSL